MTNEPLPRPLRDDLLMLIEALPRSERTIPALAVIRTRLMQESDGDVLRRYLSEIAQVMIDARAAAEEDRSERDRRLREVRQRMQQLEAGLASLPAASADPLRAALHELNDCASVLQRELAPAPLRNLLDPLTGIANRVAFDQRLRLEYARWKRYATPVVLQWWGIDGFDAIRERHGSPGADLALMHVARLLAGGLRETDFVARYENEEYAVVLPETQLDASHTVAERLRQKAISLRVTLRGALIGVTLSCGYTEFTDGDTAASAVTRCRAAFARARAAGAGGYTAGR